MEWDAEERDAWVPDAQRWIGQIKGVLQSKIELDDEGRIAGIHVVAGFDREPRYIVRDVESLLKARLGIDVNYKKIGVVQVLEAGEDEEAAELAAAGAGEAVPETAAPVSPAAEPDTDANAAGELPGGVSFHPPAGDAADEGAVTLEDLLDEQARETGGRTADDAGGGPADREAPPIPAVLVAEDLQPRIRCVGVGIMVRENRVQAEVQLAADKTEVRGLRERPNHPGADLRVIAEAALEAVTRLYDARFLLHLEDISIASPAGVQAVLAAVNLVEGRRSEILLGACALDHNRQQAVVFAVLDALNRRLSQYPLQESAAE